eukprot:1493781-Prymnesium_polylepis.1
MGCTAAPAYERGWGTAARRCALLANQHLAAVRPPASYSLLPHRLPLALRDRAHMRAGAVVMPDLGP